jgi:hypothetical protein
MIIRNIESGKAKIVAEVGDAYRERFFVRDADSWVSALETEPFVCIPQEKGRSSARSSPESVKLVGSDGVIRAEFDHPSYAISRVVLLDSSREDVFHVSMTFAAKSEIRLHAIEDRYFFLPEMRTDAGPELGPLDFVWSQHIKRFPTSVIPHYCFKFPAIMLQQGPVFAAIVAGLEDVDAAYLKRAPLGFDLSVDIAERPWISTGLISSQPVRPNMPCEAGHSSFVRGVYEDYCTIVLKAGETVDYRYSIVCSAQPRNLGYRSLVRYVWARYGVSGLAKTRDTQRHPDDERIELFDEWRENVWGREAERKYFSYKRNGVTVGSLTSSRQGEIDSRTNTGLDAWFTCWHQELWIGWGLWMYARRDKPLWKERAETILNFILTAPRTGGMFPVICYHEADGSDTWLRDDGWAGYREEFHTIQMSWTAWLLLLWAQELFPDRRDEIIAFCGPYADFLSRCQHEDGCIPSWFGPDGKPSRPSFRDFNAETATSALFLLELARMTSVDRWRAAGEKAIGFVVVKVVPRQRWSDYEAFVSCARKPFDFYDSYTSQYPQNNLSTFHAAFAFLAKYRLTKDPGDLEYGERILDYLLLTQQVWDHPLLARNVFGGFTTQNTDSEWSDARGGICAFLLLRYYECTGKREYLERAVAAMRSGFAVVPYENWAHWGFDGLQYDSSMVWGAGTTLVGVEILSGALGDLYVDLRGGWAIGINACVVESSEVMGRRVALVVDPSRAWIGKEMRIRFSAASGAYEVEINGLAIGTYTPEQLEAGVSWVVRA